MTSEFCKELTELILKHRVQNESNTPIHIFVDYLIGCIENFDKCLIKTNDYYQQPIKYYDASKIAKL